MINPAGGDGGLGGEGGFGGEGGLGGEGGELGVGGTNTTGGVAGTGGSAGTGTAGTTSGGAGSAGTSGVGGAAGTAGAGAGTSGAGGTAGAGTSGAGGTAGLSGAGGTAGTGGAGNGCVSGGSVRADYSRQNTTGQIEYEIDVVNLGASAILPSQVEVRYYFTQESAGTPLTGATVVNQLQDPYNAAGGGTVTNAVVALGTPVTGADHYLRTTFAGTTAIVQNQRLTFRVYWQPANQTQAGDYSYGSSASKVTGYDHVVVLVNGTPQWGCTP